MKKAHNFNIEKYLNSLFETISHHLTSVEFYWQLSAVLSSLIIALICYKIVRIFLFPKIISALSQKSTALSNFFEKYFVGLALPLFFTFFLVSGTIFHSAFFADVLLFETSLKLVTLFLFLRFLRISSESTLITNIAAFVLVPIVLLHAFDLLAPTTAFLDSFDAQFGKFRISIYIVIKAIIILVAIIWFSNLISRKSKLYIENSKNIKSSTKGIIVKLIDIIVYFVLFIVGLRVFGFDVTTFAVIGGAIGVGIGFGLQRIASNFISGIILLAEKSIEVGDIIEIENSKIFGTVKYFGGRYTLIEGFDGDEILIPNEDFIINRVKNWTYSNNRCRITVNVKISYDSDFELAKKIMLEVANQHPKCLHYPEAECFITEFAEFEIKIVLYFWINDISQGRLGVRSDVMMNIIKKFSEHGIEIPLPQRELRHKENISGKNKDKLKGE